MRQPLFNFSYRKVGGLHFIKLGRFGCSFYVSKPVIEAKEVRCAYATARRPHLRHRVP